MDIPNSGAIFTLGKSYLADNSQSYFYIKNDPITRLAAGPHQSAVICESGRLFVWGENLHGQLGVGGGGNSNNADLVTKPTCVKPLKTLGLKIADIAFGTDWAIVLTHSNELFYSGHSIFDADAAAARNFTEATVAGERCKIIRKPFRLEEFDDCLSKSEEAESFVTVLAGNKHFAALTSFGRLIGWGANYSCQLGCPSKASLLLPHEIVLDAPVQQFACGPESTLVLTSSGALHLTGRLNEFVFPQFTELQKSLAPGEQIIHMHISKASDIFIVTNAGSIYRSLESVRNKSLMFQRFYDYDSEEHGPIWKLQKGLAYFAVLTQAHKFFTTFSESGHHLKTFREITKFKNLRLLDMAVGEQHVLVHGIPRSATHAAIGADGKHQFVSQAYALNGNGFHERPAHNHSSQRRRGSKQNTNTTPIVAQVATTANNNTDDTHTRTANEVNGQSMEITENTNTNDNENRPIVEPEAANMTADANDNAAQGDIGKLADTAKASFTALESLVSNNVELSPANAGGNGVQCNGNTMPGEDKSSPTESVRSRRSIRFETTVGLEKSPASYASEKQLRPRTPYPTEGGTPQTSKKTPLRNYSYEAAMEQDFIEHTSPALADSLEHIPEADGTDEAIEAANEPPITAIMVNSSLPADENDEQLAVEISETVDALDRTTVVNEIRFINNGVDVTANVKQRTMASHEMTMSSEESPEDSIAETRREAENILDELEVQIEAKMKKAKDKTSEWQEQALIVTDELENEAHEAGGKVETSGEKAVIEARDTVDTMGENMKRMAGGAVQAVGHAGSTVLRTAGGAVDAAGENAKRIASDAKHAVENAGSTAIRKAGGAVDAAGENAKRMASDTKQAVENASNTAIRAAGGAVDAAGGNAKRMASDAKQAVENAGSTAMKTAGGAGKAVGSAMENALFRMADGTKYAVDTMASKISSEVQGAKENISSMLHSKSSKNTAAGTADDDVSSKDGGPRTNTTGEDDERTTASVNSTHTSTGGGNPFESTNPFENELDDVIGQGKKAMTAIDHRIEEAEGRGKVRQLISDIRAKGISCRNEKAIRVDDDEPHYTTVEDTHGRAATTNPQNTSKICTIL